MDSKIKNVIFDLGGVLINLDFDSCLNAFRTAGFTNIEEQVRQMQGNGVFSRFELGEISPEEFRAAVTYLYRYRMEKADTEKPSEKICGSASVSM